MNRGNTDYLGFVNSNPKVPLNTLVATSKEYLATMSLCANDEIYYEFNNPQYSNLKSQPDITVLPYQVRFKINGSVNIAASLRSTNSDTSISLNIKVNGKRIESMRTDSKTATIITTKISIKQDDVVTFELSCNSRDASAYLSANGLMLLARVTKLYENDLVEVIE